MSAADRATPPAPRPLAGRVVLVPRLREPDPLAEALRTAGAEAVRAALTRTVAGDAAELASASARLAAGEYDWLVVTSARTVEMLDVGAAPVSTAVAAVGSATARVLAAALGRNPDLVAGGSARALLEALAGRGVAPGARVLLPQSALAAPLLAEGLRGLGAHVERVDAYTTRTAAPADLPPGLVGRWRAGGVDAVVVTAGSTARAAVELLGPAPPGTAVIALGGPSRAAAAAAGLAPAGDIAASPSPSPDDVVAEIIAGIDRRPRPLRPGSHAGATPPHPPTDRRPAEPAATQPHRGIMTEHTAPASPAAPEPATPGASAAPTLAEPAEPAEPAGVSPAAGFLADRGVPAPSAPVIRPRRLRTTPAMRGLVAQTRIRPDALIYPVFVREDIAEPRPIGAMPGQWQHTLDSVRREAAACAAAGVGAIDLFGVPATRDETGSGAWAEDGILNRAIAAVRAEVGDALVVCADTCLDEFTSHGHCGVLRPGPGPRAGEVDNDPTLALYQAMAVAQAEAGAHMVSPSGMMDGQVAAIRAALDATGHDDVAILAYSAKYASAYFGPFREAVGSTLTGDRRTYQQDPANRREGLREVMLDVEQGADMVMVKPAGPYLDVLADVAAASPVPVAAYQVSGEYAMVEAAAANGWIDRERVIAESVLGIVRAGADCVLTYWARELAEGLGGR